MLAFTFLRSFAAKTARQCLTLAAVASLCLFSAGNDAAADEVEISNLTDVNVPQWVTGDSDINQYVLVCVYRANTSGNARTYGIEATGDGPGFYLKSGSSTIPYTLTWNDGGAGNPNGGAASALINNVVLSAQDNARNNLDTPTNSADCNGGTSPTAQLTLTVSAANMDAAPDGTYSGTITLLLSLM